jgi:hypothetical protein
LPRALRKKRQAFRHDLEALAIFEKKYFFDFLNNF